MSSTDPDADQASPSTEGRNGGQTNGKRKRSGTDGEPTLSGRAASDIGLRELQLQGFLQDALEVLKSYDTKPSILRQHIRSTASEPQSTKRLKLSSPSEQTQTTSVLAQIESRAYRSIDQVLADVDEAISAIVSPSKGSAATATSQAKREQQLIHRFKQELDDLIAGDSPQPPAGTVASPSEDWFKRRTAKLVNGIEHLDTLSEPRSEEHMILTLYGHGGQQVPKQLFTSLRQVSAKSIVGSEITRASHFTPIRESALPNGISTTIIVPTSETGGESVKRKQPTLGEKFPAPATLPPLNPPRASSYTATRSQSVNWYDPWKPITKPRGNGRESFPNQPLSSGRGLSYNSHFPPERPSSPEKRKQRDRALSATETRVEPTPEENVEVQRAKNLRQEAKEDALFKSVYSSFAPSYDNSAALVPQQLRDRLWWADVGRVRYLQYMDSEEGAPIEEKLKKLSEDCIDPELNEERVFEEAVASFEAVEPPTVEADSIVEGGHGSRDAEELLHDISKLLETLNSYQRVRGLFPAATSRPPASQNKQSTILAAGPSKLSSDETDVYSMLKSQLALLISSLPPYAVAKLDGQQINALNISTKIPLEVPNHKGTLEDPSRILGYGQAPTPAIRNTTSQMATSARPGSSYQQPGGTPQSRGSYTAPRASVGASYSPHVNRAHSLQQYGSYTSQQPTRSSLYAQYSQQTPSTHHPNGYRATPNGYGTYNQNYNANPPASSPSAARTSQQQLRPSQAGHQQRPQGPQTHNYQLAGTTLRGSSLPNAAAGYTVASQRTTHATEQTTQQQRPAYYGTTPSGTLSLGNGGTIGDALSMTPEEQAMLMNRQKTQLQQMQQMSVRQGSGTPRPASASSPMATTPTPAPPAPMLVGNGP